MPFESNIDKAGDNAAKSQINAADYQVGADYGINTSGVSGRLPMGGSELPNCEIIHSRTASQCDTIPGLPNETPETPEQHPIFQPNVVPGATIDRTPPTPPTPPYLPMPPAHQERDRNPAVVNPTPHDFGGHPPVFRPSGPQLE